MAIKILLIAILSIIATSVNAEQQSDIPASFRVLRESTVPQGGTELCIIVSSEHSDTHKAQLLLASQLALSLLRKGDSICIISTSKTPELLFPLTSVLEASDKLKQISELKFNSGSNTFAAIAKSAEEFSNNNNSKKRILLLSSNEKLGTNDRHTKRLLERLACDGIVLSAVALGKNHLEEFFFTIAKTTLGEYRFAYSSEELLAETELATKFLSNSTPLGAILDINGKTYSYKFSKNHSKLLLFGRQRTTCLNNSDQATELNSKNTKLIALWGDSATKSNRTSNSERKPRIDLEISESNQLQYRYHHTLVKLSSLLADNKTQKAEELLKLQIETLERSIRGRDKSHLDLLTAFKKLKSTLTLESKTHAKRTLLKLRLIPTSIVAIDEI